MGWEEDSRQISGEKKCFGYSIPYSMNLVSRQLLLLLLFKTSGRHQRNLAITSGVTASILVTPVLAGLAVSIGVPILLAYVYGVVPISLCR